MRIKQYLPNTLLQPFIKNFLIIESDDGMENRILPDTSIVMAFTFRGMVNAMENGHQYVLPQAVMTGLRRSQRLLRYAKATSTLLVVFKEGGAASFFKDPLNELFGASVALENFMRRQQIADIEEKLAEAGTHANRIAVIEKYLLLKLNPAKADALIFNTIHQ